MEASHASADELLRSLHAALPGSERLFDAVVGSLADPVTIRDRQNRIVYANQAAVESLGYTTRDELRNADTAEIMADYVVTGEDGRPIEMAQIPSVRLLRGEDADPLLIRTVHRVTGRVMWQRLKASPLRDDDGEIAATVMIIEDVTEQTQARLRSAYLARATELLASSLDYEQTLSTIAELAVPSIADWCSVDLVGESSDPDEGVARVVRTGKPLLYADVTDERLREAGMRSVAIVPIRGSSRTLGALTLVQAESGRKLVGDDVVLAEQIAGRAGVAIENAELYRERSRIADTLQRSLLPEPLPAVPGYEIASLYRSARDGSEVGGDFYELWEVDEGWLLALGDVTGRGVEAAVLTALARHTLRTASEFVSSPAALLARLDRTLRGQRQTSICTALCVRIEPDRMVLSAGGHPLPLLVSSDGVHTLGAPGPLLGAFPDATLRDVVEPFPRGSALVAYTDGVTDAVGPGGERFELERLQATLAGCRDCGPQKVIDTLTRALDEFGGGLQGDDTAAVVIRRH